MIRSLRTSSAIVALFAASGAMVSPGAAQPDGGADLILRGGTIYSGEAAPFRGDVAIRGDRITYVGPRSEERSVGNGWVSTVRARWSPYPYKTIKYCKHIISRTTHHGVTQ